MGTPAPTPGPSGAPDPHDAATTDRSDEGEVGQGEVGEGETGGDEVGEPVLVSVDQRRPGTRNPHQSRVRALKVLFQADLRGEDPSATVAGIATDPAAVALLDDLDVDGADEATGDATGDDGLDDYARTLIDGVAQRRHALDRIISRFSHRWEVNRMPVVDRNILRLGAWELLFEDVSAAVVIDEALELAKQHSTDASHRFVNGILEAVRRDATDLRTELESATFIADLADVDEPDAVQGVTGDGGTTEPTPSDDPEDPDEPTPGEHTGPADEASGGASWEPTTDFATGDVGLARDEPGGTEALDDHAVVCTWNPDTSYHLPESDRAEAVKVTRGGGAWSFAWSIGRHRTGIGPGTPVYLFRQGRQARGIVAKGIVTSEPFDAERWDDSEKTTRFVDIDWDVFLPEEQRLDVRRLQEQIPDGKWNSRPQSGAPLRQPALEQLADLFSHHLAQIGWYEGVHRV